MIRRDPPSAADVELAELRRLLFERENARLEKIERKIEQEQLDPESVSNVLPKAFMLSQDDPTLTHAMAKPVESALQRSVQKNPGPLVDAIYPAIGPAIRKAVAAAISSMVQGLNAAIEHSFSPRSLKWRFDAWRTGKKFSEVVLLKTLVFRVEQVFLIHRETGLLLRHIAAPAVEAKDADLVSAMLTAIQDFVRDSFDATGKDTVRTMNVGEFTVWAEQGPNAVLACSIRGTPPAELRGVVQHALEECHQDMAVELTEFSGDVEPFAATEAHLEECLLQAKTEKSNDTRNAILCLVLLAVIIGLGYLWFESRLRQSRWDQFVAAAEREPGLVVTESGERDGKFYIVGLRDPLAADPASLLGDVDAEEVDHQWRSYHAQEPAFLERRAASALRPPAGVTLAVAGDRIVATGRARHAWMERAQVAGALLAGGIDLTAVVDIDAERFAACRKAIEAAETLAAVPGLLEMVRELRRRSRALGREAWVEIDGRQAAAARDALVAAGADRSGVRLSANSFGPLDLRIVVAPE